MRLLKRCWTGQRGGISHRKTAVSHRGGGGGVGGSDRGALWTLKLKSAGIRLSLEGCLNEQPKILAERLELVFD